MASRGRGRRGRPRGTDQAPPVFDQQAFTKAVGIAAVAISHAGIADRHEDPNNLQKFRAHHPLTFTGGGDPMVADHWFMQIEKVLEAMEITSDATRIRLATFQLEVETLKEPFVCEFSPRDLGENRDDMSRLRAGDLGNSTHSGPKDHGHIRVRCHPGDGLADSLQDRFTVVERPSAVRQVQ